MQGQDRDAGRRPHGTSPSDGLSSRWVGQQTAWQLTICPTVEVGSWQIIGHVLGRSNDLLRIRVVVVGIPQRSFLCGQTGGLLLRCACPLRAAIDCQPAGCHRHCVPR